MGDYGANPNPDIDAIMQIAWAYRMAPLGKLKVDQFSTVTNNKVFSLVEKIGSTRLLVLVDPAEIPS